MAAWILAISSFLAAQPEGSPGVFHVVQLDSIDAATLNAMIDEGYIVDNVQENLITLYVTDIQLRSLQLQGLSPLVLETQVPDETKSLGAYHSYAQLTSELQAYAAAFPHICALESIGQSVQGRELWVLRITDHPELEEDEPEFRYISTMHGDEPVGTENCLYFIDLLLNSYGSDSRISELIDETDISILPLMNPDGLQLGTRVNANGIDLNRAFPKYPEDFSTSMFQGGAFAAAGRQPEVLAVMQWSAANSFALAANLHTGALLVNYPYDDGGVPSGVYAMCPDDALFREISLAYSSHNTPMFTSPFFAQGITNGSDWFRARGGLQDWNYRFLSCPEVTIELSNTKRPAAGTLSTLWANNQESMFAYLECIHKGLRGLVLDRETGEPVHAQILVEGNTQPVETDPDVGNYHRLLLPGSYAVSVSAPGYVEQRVEAVQVVPDSATRLNVRLLAEGDSDGDGHPNSLEGIEDTDGDGLENYRDIDSDHDRVPDAEEPAIDPDNDGAMDFLDTDSDNDGFDDYHERVAHTDPDDPLDFPVLPLPAVGFPAIVALCLGIAISARRSMRHS